MRKSITTRYFYATALLLIASTALMGFIQMYLSMVFFRVQSDRDLLLTVDNTIQILQEVQADHLNDTEARALMNREITLTARASDNNIFVTDVYGRIVLGSTKDPVEYIEEYYIDAYLPEKAVRAPTITDAIRIWERSTACCPCARTLPESLCALTAI